MTIDNYADWLAGGGRITPAGSNHQVFVRQDGPADGTPLTLLHGFPTSSHDWAPVLDHLLAAGHRVTALDLLGYGDSDKPRGHRYSILEQADLVEGMWTTLGIDTTAVIAHDVGDTVAQELLARNPSRISTMTWLNGGLYPELHRRTRSQRLLHGPLGPFVARLMTESRFRAGLTEVLGRPVPPEIMHAMWLGVERRRGVHALPSLLDYLDEREKYRERWGTALETYPGPQRFVWGPADPVSGAHMIAEVRRRIPHADVHVLDGVGHYPQVEAPDLVGPLVTAPFNPPS